MEIQNNETIPRQIPMTHEPFLYSTYVFCEFPAQFTPFPHNPTQVSLKSNNLKFKALTQIIKLINLICLLTFYPNSKN